MLGSFGAPAERSKLLMEVLPLPGRRLVPAVGGAVFAGTATILVLVITGAIAGSAVVDGSLMRHPIDRFLPLRSAVLPIRLSGTRYSMYMLLASSQLKETFTLFSTMII